MAAIGIHAILRLYEVLWSTAGTDGPPLAAGVHPRAWLQTTIEFGSRDYGWETAASYDVSGARYR